MFKENKKNILEKNDKSPKGSVDSKIKNFVDLINSNEKFCTTSSCAGRIVLIDGNKKGSSKWLFVTHDEIKFEDVKNNLNSNEVWIRSEPMIMHVSCIDLDSAFDLINLTRNLGFKRSGLQSKNKLIVEISSSEILDNLLVKNNKLLVDDNYIKEIILEANNKLKETHKKIKIFEEEFKKL